jgi:hypothetical protein
MIAKMTVVWRLCGAVTDIDVTNKKSQQVLLLAV